LVDAFRLTRECDRLVAQQRGKVLPSEVLQGGFDYHRRIETDRPRIHALFGFLDNPEMVAALTALASDGPRLFPGEPESDEGQ
jgi:hypothetical protein